MRKINKNLFTLRASFLAFLHAIGFVVVVASIAGFFSDRHWMLELCSHFRVQYVGAFVVLLIVSVTFKNLRATLVYLLMFLLNLGQFFPYFFKEKESYREIEIYRVMLFNVYADNKHREEVLGYIKEVKPDVLLLEEINAEWYHYLEENLKEYPHRIALSREDNFGIGLYSRLPLKDARIERIGNARVPSVLTGIEMAGQEIFFLGTHPLPPASESYSKLRNQQMNRLKKVVLEARKPTLLMGNLNMTPWSRYFREFLEDTGLLDSMDGYGVQATWPAGAWPFQIPIDHLFHSSEFIIMNRKIGKDLFSDHYPVIVDVGIRRKY